MEIYIENYLRRLELLKIAYMKKQNFEMAAKSRQMQRDIMPDCFKNHQEFVLMLLH